MSVVNNYEAVLIFSLKDGEEAAKALTEKFKTLTESNGQDLVIDTWGKRRLAYPINDETDGYYELFTFKSPTSYPAEFERVLKITDGVLRSMIINKN